MNYDQTNNAHSHSKEIGHGTKMLIGKVDYRHQGHQPCEKVKQMQDQTEFHFFMKLQPIRVQFIHHLDFKDK